MLNDKTRAELDQASAMVAETFPTLWRSIYDGLIKEGFTEPQAMKILCTYITTAFGAK